MGRIGKKPSSPVESISPTNCFPRGRVPESSAHSVLQVRLGPPTFSPTKICPVCGAHRGTYRKRGGGERIFKISWPGGRLHPLPMNERSLEVPRVWPSAGSRATSLRLLAPAPRANSRDSLPSALQAQ